MRELIAYFIKNRHLNYAILTLIFLVGLLSYSAMPKEIFPDFTFDKIAISGSYAGSSADNLDKMAVRDIESGLSALNHVYKVETTVQAGSFQVLLSIDSGGDVATILNKVKDEIAKIMPNLPSDMDEPIAQQLDRTRELIRVSISSKTLEFGSLIDQAREIKDSILKLNKVSGVTIYGESDEVVEFKIDSLAIKAYGLNPSDITSAINNLSYTFPLGEIEQDGEFIFVSTTSGKGSIKEWEDTLIRVGKKSLYLKDIASIRKYRPQEATLSSFNGASNISLLVNKDVSANSIKLKNQITTLINNSRSSYPDLSLTLYADSSKMVDARLGTIISNLTLGLILIFFTMKYLINTRTAIVVTLGIPFAFLIGIIFVYYLGYSLNMITLIGALLVIGIAVDDAVVVSENIQRHLEEGLSKTQAAIEGTKEMIMPITLATLTTVAAFIPIFMMSGTTGTFLMLIPIVVIAVLFGSLIESFFFLPLHATELLQKESNTLNWDWFNSKYERALHIVIENRYKSFLVFIIVIIATIMISVKIMGFQFFLKIDVDSMKLGGQFPISTPIEKTFDVAKEIEAELLSKKRELSIKDVSAIAGTRVTLKGQGASGSNNFTILIELHKRKDENFINKYVNPILDFSFNFSNPDKTREIDAEGIGKKIQVILDKYKTKYNMIEAYVRIDGPHLVQTDIQINLIGRDNKTLDNQIKTIQAKLREIEGTKDISDNISAGKQEFKIKINNYGELLGFDETKVARVLSRYFLGNRSATTYSKDGVISITTEDINKNKVSTLEDFEVPVGDGRYVKLNDIVDFVIVDDYEKIAKENGQKVKYVTANVNKDITTASKVLKKLKPLLKEIKQTTEVKLLGEKEKNEELIADMKRSAIIAIGSILILLLLIFPKIKYVFMIISVIPLSFVGALWGHWIVGFNFTMPSAIGMLGLAGVVINDGIIMLDFLHGTRDIDKFYYRAKLRLRPIVITTITTFVGLTTLMFFSTGQALMMAPIAVSLGFGLMWGTVLNLFYLPTLYALVNKIKPSDKTAKQKQENHHVNKPTF
jgi:multidrug efflux pump subunit AcrB